MRAAVALLIAACCAHVPAGARFGPEHAPAALASTVRVVVLYADGHGVLGAGVAVTPRHVITARHVLHGRPEVEPMAIWVVVQDGTRIEVVADAESETVDAARLVVVGTGAPLRPAVVDRAPAQVAVELCVVTGQHLIKCGRVADAAGSQVIVGIRLVPGNSGSPLFDGAGRVRGIAVARQPDPAQDDVAQAVAAGAWGELVPPPDLI